MMDDLVKEARDEARFGGGVQSARQLLMRIATALEAAQARIAELEKHCADVNGNAHQYQLLAEQNTRDRQAAQALNAELVAALRETLEEAAKIVSEAADRFGECERLIPMDIDTGVLECSLDTRGGSCLCLERIEEAEEIQQRIRSRILALAALDNPGTTEGT